MVKRVEIKLFNLFSGEMVQFRGKWCIFDMQNS